MESTQTNPLERTLKLTVAVADIQVEVDKRLKNLAKTAKMQGFRPGKVPMNVLSRAYGAQLNQEALEELAEISFGKAVNQQNLQVAGVPMLTPEADNPEGQIAFNATFEVYPEITLGDLSAQVVERPVTQVTDADVDATIDILRKQQVRYEAVDRAAQDGDQIRMDFKGFKDDEAFAGGEAKDYPLVLGQGRFLPDFEANMVGMKAGETKSFNLTFPENYGSADLAGKPVRFDVTLHQVMGPVLPEVNADFARALGVKSGDIETMRAELKQNLTRELKVHIKARLKDQVMQALLNTHTFDLPSALVKREIDALRNRTLSEIEARTGRKQEQALPDEVFEQDARRRVSLGLILDAVVTEHKLESTPERVRTLIEEMAEAYEKPDEMVKWYYQQPQRMRDVQALVVEDMIVEWALTKTDTRDVDTPFNQITQRS
jgi:trigger factor